MSSIASSIASSKPSLIKNKKPVQDALPQRESPPHNDWNLGWWDLLPTLTPSEQRPLAWTSSGLLTAHPYLPQILLRVFPSRQSSPLVLPDPPPITGSPDSYSSPTTIIVSPREDFLYAYFPGNNGSGGLGCIWQETESVGWMVRQWWTYPINETVVNGWWLGEDRKWLGTTRLPFLGPFVASMAPTLLVLKSCLTIQLVHLPLHLPSGEFEFTYATTRQATTNTELSNSSNLALEGGRVCVRGAMGLGYNEKSLIIATHSHLIPPPPSSQAAPSFTVPLSLTIPSEQDLNQEASNHDWESYGPEITLDLCEVQVFSGGGHLSLSTTPLLSIPMHSPNLSHLAFMPILPPPLPPPKSPEGSIIEHTDEENDQKPGFSLLAGFTDFGDYLSPPRSSLSLYTIKASSTTRAHWSVQLRATRDFSLEQCALAFLGPSVLFIEPKQEVLVGLLDLGGKFAPGNKELKTGDIRILQFPNLNDDEDFSSTTLVAHTRDDIGDPPISYVLSPNHCLICTASASAQFKLSIHRYPCRRPLPSDEQTPELSAQLQSLLLADRSPSDILHTLPHSSHDIIAAGLTHALQVVSSTGMGGGEARWQREIAKFNVDLLMNPSRSPGYSREQLQARQTVAVDICSLIACDDAMEQWKEMESVLGDPDLIWAIVNMSRWVINFVERIIHEAIYFQAESERKSSEEMAVDAPSPPQDELPPAFVHVLQPFLLANLVTSLSRILQNYNTLKATVTLNTANGTSPLPAKTQIARDSLVDIVENSAVDLANLVEELKFHQVTMAKVDAHVLQDLLVSLRVPKSLEAQVAIIASKITDRRITNRVRLFVHCADFLFGEGGTGFSKKEGEQEIDVITKAALSLEGVKRVCNRCGGKSESGLGPPAARKSRWTTWESGWVRCICGGSFRHVYPNHQPMLLL